MPKHFHRTSALVKHAVAECEAVRKQPALLVGDLNAEIEELPVAFALGCSDWTDPGTGKGTSSAAWEPRRIDCTLLNPAMRNRLVEHSMNWSSGTPTSSPNGNLVTSTAASAQRTAAGGGAKGPSSLLARDSPWTGVRL